MLGCTYFLNYCFIISSSREVQKDLTTHWVGRVGVQHFFPKRSNKKKKLKINLTQVFFRIRLHQGAWDNSREEEWSVQLKWLKSLAKIAIASIWRENILGYLSRDICLGYMFPRSKHPRKTLSFGRRLMFFYSCSLHFNQGRVKIRGLFSTRLRSSWAFNERQISPKCKYNFLFFLVDKKNNCTTVVVTDKADNRGDW